MKVYGEIQNDVITRCIPRCISDTMQFCIRYTNEGNKCQERPGISRQWCFLGAVERTARVSFRFCFPYGKPKSS